MLQNKSQCGFDGLIPHRFPVAGEVIFHRVGMRRVLIADENRSHTVSEFVAAGAGQTRDRHGRVCFQQRPDTGSQMLRRPQRHRAVLRQNLSRHAQFSLTQLV